MWKEKLVLAPGQELRATDTQRSRHIGQDAVNRYDVVDSAGQVVGHVTLTEQTSVRKPFRSTYRLVQEDSTGKEIVSVRW